MAELPQKHRVSVSWVLKILGVSRSGYRAWKQRVPSVSEKHRDHIKDAIKQIYDGSHQNYGAPKITEMLHRQGESIAEKTVGNYMRQMGIKAQWVKPYTVTTIDSDFNSELQNILDEQFNPSRPDAVWVSMIFGEEPENLLNEKMDMEAMENPMFCLTNKAKMNGASLLLQEDIRKQIGECLGSDYFVIPSSVHEVLILPDNGIFQVPELNAMVQEVNETQVERQEQLSDKVQFCDKKTAVMENAERREARLEKEKAAEKAEVKGGIHGRLEKAKAEIKAKEADKVPKNKSKELATAL